MAPMARFENAAIYVGPMKIVHTNYIVVEGRRFKFLVGMLCFS